MGMALHVYAVDLEQLRRVFGSRDETIRAQVEAKYKDELDDDEDPHNRDELPPGTPTMRQALAEILDKDLNYLRGVWAASYTEVLELVCAVIGETIHENLGDWHPYLSRAGYVLEERGIAKLASFKKLINGPDAFGLVGTPVGDFPAFGFVELADIRAALEKMRPLDVMGLEKEVAVYLVIFYGWLEKAEKSGKSLVGFYD